MAGIVFSRSSGLNDSIYGKSEAPIRSFLERRELANSQFSIADKLFKSVDSTHYAEKFGSMTSFASGFKPVLEGAAYPLDDRQEGYSKTIEAVEWKNGFQITQTAMEDNVILDLSRTDAGAFMDEYHYGKEAFAGALLTGALTVANTTVTYEGMSFSTTGADGVSLFNASHPSKTGNVAVQSNVFADAFSADALGGIMTKMQNVTDDNGKKLTITPDTIVIPNDYTLKKAVFAAVGSDKDPGTANNGFNFLFGNWRVIVSPYLNSMIGVTDKPYILIDSKYNESHDCLLWLNRVPLTIRAWIDENTGNNVWSGRSRFSAGFVDWRGTAVGGVTGGTAL